MGIPRAHGLQPHRVRQFKLSKDPEFVGKLRDVENQRPVDTAVTLASGTELDGSYADSAELIQALARSNAVKTCLARQIFRSSAARSDDSVAGAESAFVDFWQQLPPERQDHLADVLVAFVKSPSFIERRTL